MNPTRLTLTPAHEMDRLLRWIEARSAMFNLLPPGERIALAVQLNDARKVVVRLSQRLDANYTNFHQ